jgi:hypothetical protein
MGYPAWFARNPFSMVSRSHLSNRVMKARMDGSFTTGHAGNWPQPELAN